MLPSGLRLTSPQDFRRVYRKGNQIHTRNLRLFSLADNQNRSRFGFVVSKSQVSQIVRRNRVKRILRALVFLRLNDFPKGFLYIFHGKLGIAKCNSKVLGEEIEELLKKLQNRLGKK